MENKIEQTKKKPSEETLKLVDELGNCNSDKGDWINIEGIGWVWKPISQDESDRVVPTPSIPPSIMGEIVRWGNTIDIDNISQNSVMLIKLNVDDPHRIQIMQRVIAKQVLEPRIEKLKEKRVCVLFMQEGDDISVISEEDMQKAGWEKKEKSRIITL